MASFYWKIQYSETLNLKRGKSLISKKQLVTITESSIKNLINSFQKSPYTFYTESDLHCYLYNQIYTSLPAEQWFCKTSNQESILIHKEYPTKERYSRKSLTEGLEKGSRGHFDLTIWNPERTQERAFRAKDQKFEEEQQTFIAIEFDLEENKADVENAVHHLRWDLMKLRGTKNEVENGYLLTFGRDWAYEKDFLEKVKQFTATEKEVTVIYIGGSCKNDIVQLSKKTIF